MVEDPTHIPWPIIGRTQVFVVNLPIVAALVVGGWSLSAVKWDVAAPDVRMSDLFPFTDCVLLFCLFALLGSVVFSRGSKKYLFGTLYKNSEANAEPRRHIRKIEIS